MLDAEVDLVYEFKFSVDIVLFILLVDMLSTSKIYVRFKMKEVGNLLVTSQKLKMKAVSAKEASTVVCNCMEGQIRWCI